MLKRAPVLLIRTWSQKPSNIGGHHCDITTLSSTLVHGFLELAPEESLAIWMTRTNECS